MNRFNGKTVVITGGGSGIGLSIAERFAREGSAVVVSDVNGDSAKAAAERIAAGGAKALARKTDVAQENDVRKLLDDAVKEFGAVDIMVNNAGVGEKPDPIDQKTAEDWNRVISINLSGAFFGIKHAARVMKAASRPGVIINVGSILSVVGFNGAPAYVAAKHGLLGLTRAAALELAPARIRVVAVSPAFIKTPLIHGLEEAVLPLHPIGRLGEPEEVANLVVFLGSDEASFMTGATYLVDGGYTAQ